MGHRLLYQRLDILVQRQHHRVALAAVALCDKPAAIASTAAAGLLGFFACCHWAIRARASSAGITA
jgi:hypothetical protein